MDLESFGLEKYTWKYRHSIKELTASSVYRVCSNSALKGYGFYEISFTLELLDNDLGDIDDIIKHKRLLNPDDSSDLKYPNVGSGVFLRAIVVKESDLKDLESDLLTKGEALLKREPVYYFLSHDPLTIESIIYPEQNRWMKRIEEGINAIMAYITR